MGYYVSGTGSFTIKKENLDAAHAALVALQDAPDKAKGGGVYGGPDNGKRWFSWMPDDLRTLTSAKEVFEALGFECDIEDDNLIVGGYDSKTGQEDVFACAAAPYIEDGEYEWTGEDGEFWAWKFISGRMFILEGRRVYSHASPVEVKLESLLKG